MKVRVNDAGAYKHNFEAIADVLELNGIIALGWGAEIGVRQGLFSEYLLECFPALRLRLVDPYAPYQDVDRFYTKEDQDAILKECMERLGFFMPRLAFYFEPSTEAAAHVPDRGLDFVFIDAQHTFEAALADCKAWGPKVRSGGLLCGHDYAMSSVRDAVDKYARLRGLEVQHIGLPADVWLMVMP